MSPLTGQHTRFTEDRPMNRPFEILIFILAFLVGLGVVFGHARPESITTILPHWLGLFWGWSMLMGAGFGVFGLFWKGKPLTSYGLEQVGLLLSGGASLVYGVVVVTVLGATASVAAVYCVGFGLASFIRAWQLRTPMNRIRDAGIYRRGPRAG